MKRFLINTAIWYILLSIGMFILFILFDVHGHIGARIVIAMIFALIKPLGESFNEIKNKF
jgi:hypothetical protein